MVKVTKNQNILLKLKISILPNLKLQLRSIENSVIATKRDMPKKPEWGWIDNHPIINTSWNDAIGYIEWFK
ncbi:hypothetical protein SB49_00030 [Sediminicola sp. YIK13]|nr:hypothetical protein SB49_00030 [Sediminicola sp. YIK13]